jgi:NAD(P)-dependent dehydrogenase (short-subunit alcohol dehydrogenase family)
VATGKAKHRRDQLRTENLASGIGRSVAVLFAREGANVVICYNSNTEDAQKTKEVVEKEGRQAITIQGDIGLKHTCNKIIEQTVIIECNIRTYCSH